MKHHFVRLVNDGDTIVGVFVGEPSAREVIWTGERYETFDASNIAHHGRGPHVGRAAHRPTGCDQ